MYGLRAWQTSVLVLISLEALVRWPYVQSTTCYYPARDEAPVDIVCNPLAQNSACCGPGYACLVNGFCKKTAEATDGNQVVFNRGSCTDFTFAPPECPQFCKSAGSALTDLLFQEAKESNEAIKQIVKAAQLCCSAQPPMRFAAPAPTATTISSTRPPHWRVDSLRSRLSTTLVLPQPCPTIHSS